MALADGQAPYLVWCSAHVETVGQEYASARYEATTWNEAQMLVAKAHRECQARLDDPWVEHYVTRDGRRLG